MNYPYPAAAWVPDDQGGDSPSAAIAANVEFNPEDLDHFDPVDSLCGERFAATRPPTSGDPADSWLRIEFTCGEDVGHYPGTPHRGEFSWGDDTALPAQPDCGVCADVGVTAQGQPCTDCPAGAPYVAAAKVKAAKDTDRP